MEMRNADLNGFGVGVLSVGIPVIVYVNNYLNFFLQVVCS